MSAETSVDGDTTKTTEDRVVTYVLASGEHEASDLIGASVHNPAGEVIATVADIWPGANGSAPMIVVRDGGVPASAANCAPWPILRRLSPPIRTPAGTSRT